MRRIGLLLVIGLLLTPPGAEAQLTAVGGSIVAAPLGVGVQAGKLYRIGYLATDRPASNPLQGAFIKGLRELGYVEGQNVVIEYRRADGRTERLSDLASELVRLGVDVIVTSDRPRPSGPSRSRRHFPS